VVLPSLLDHMDLGEGFLDDALPFDHVEAASFRAVDLVAPEMISTLKQSSQARVTADAEFKELQADITRYAERKNRKTVSLNEATLRKERLEEKKDKKDEKLEELQNEPETDGPIFPEGFYNNELLHITADYLGLLKGLKTAKN
jgi:carboxyl-terminal processing protease